MTFELTDILASHLTMLVFVYGSAGLLLANLMGMLALGRLERTRPSGALARVARPVIPGV
jgi:hypothetical protein